jgi:ankyrin repeat protein
MLSCACVLVREILRLHPETTTQCDNGGRNALHTAVMYGHSPNVQLLMQVRCNGAVRAVCLDHPAQDLCEDVLWVKRSALDSRPV